MRAATAGPAIQVKRCVPPPPGSRPRPDLGQPELGLVGGDAQITAERQLVAATHGRAADLGKADLRQVGRCAGTAPGTAA